MFIFNFGKIIAIPVKEVTEGMRVYCNNYNLPEWAKLFIVEVIHPKDTVILRDMVMNQPFRVLVSELKELVVEYEQISPPLIGKNYICEGSRNVTIPLKYSQWQEVLDKGLVGSNKKVEFKIIKANEIGKLPTDWLQYAKIISQKEKMYSREEVESLCRKAFNAGGMFEWSQHNHHGGTHPDSDKWIEENLK